jgi:predicted enzyme related to lactoylglutathione lyase
MDEGGNVMRDATTMVDAKSILKNAPVFASFAVKDLGAARQFYASKLGLDVRDDNEMGIFEITGPDKSHVMVYPKPDHQPAVFTVLNLQVKDIDAKGVARGDKH